MIELFRSNNVVVRSVPVGDAGRWVVTFDNYGLGPGFNRPGFGEAFLRQSGVSAIHVMGRREDWYQYPEMAEAMAAVRRATAGADRVMTYGSSMGAYAALRFADAAGADAVLAISPQYSVDPAKVPFETRWLQDGRSIAFRPEIEGRLSCACRPVIVYDATGDDERQVRLIAAEIKADLIGLRYIHHPATTFLQEMALLGPLVFDVLAGDLDVEAFRAEAKARRRDSSIYLSRLAELQPVCRARTARALATLAVERAPHSPMALTALAACLGLAGEHDEAVALHERATELGLRAANHLVPHANGLIAAGRVEEALPLVEEAVDKLPTAAHLRYWHGLILWRAGKTEAAVAALEMAVLLDPHPPSYRELLDTCRTNLEPTVEVRKLARILRFVRRRIAVDGPLATARSRRRAR
ncbi:MULTISPECIES: tetratricopeptide repeat protein [unclassified Brevundimonas]|uniref:tetratricopeptide repeat protein n=1 Tax=unclassified Brevundimonas TaxID=2622653 RepID=UPI003F90A039